MVRYRYLIYSDITVLRVSIEYAGQGVVNFVVLTNSKGGSIHPDHAQLLVLRGVPATHHPRPGRGAGESYRGPLMYSMPWSQNTR